MIVSLLPSHPRIRLSVHSWTIAKRLIMGSFENFATAKANAPPSKAVGYDNARPPRTPSLL